MPGITQEQQATRYLFIYLLAYVSQYIVQSKKINQNRK